ncbi:MAG: HAMP domain-containing sensor histidine kinase [Bdellovibrionota bacterium]|nr:HAMP domain-containing sensor histidine kinase [Bdellovibrionota bacterium]
MSKELRATANLIKILEDSKKSVEKIFDSLPLIIAIIRKDGTIFRGNDTLARVLKIDKEKLINTNFNLLFEDSKWSFLSRFLANAASIESHFTSQIKLEIKIISKAYKIPSVYLWDVYNYLKRPELGDLYLVIGKDVTEIVHRQKQLETYSGNLEEIVEERTAQLKDTHNKMLDLATKSGKAEIVSNVLHLMGNMLGPINYSLGEMKNDLGSNEIHRYMEKIYETVKDKIVEFEEGKDAEKFKEDIVKLAELLKKISNANLNKDNDLIENVDFIGKKVDFLGRFLGEQEQFSNIKIQKAVHSIKKVIESCLEDQKEKMADKKVKVVENLKASIKVNLNVSKAGYVFNQLIINAIESFGEKKDPQIEISVTDGEKFVEVEIRDNGEGIVEENRSSIFNCGFSSKPGHLGIGLHQAFNFMIEMGGGLVLKNEEKKEGSSFIARFTK